MNPQEYRVYAHWLFFFQSRNVVIITYGVDKDMRLQHIQHSICWQFTYIFFSAGNFTIFHSTYFVLQSGFLRMFVYKDRVNRGIIFCDE